MVLQLGDVRALLVEGGLRHSERAMNFGAVGLHPRGRFLSEVSGNVNVLINLLFLNKLSNLVPLGLRGHGLPQVDRKPLLSLSTES